MAKNHIILIFNLLNLLAILTINITFYGAVTKPRQKVSKLSKINDSFSRKTSRSRPDRFEVLLFQCIIMVHYKFDFALNL